MPKTALPIDSHLPDVVRAVRERGGAVLVAEPGAGKTTRLPSALLDDLDAHEGEVWVLQPRRLTARMAAARVAEERGGRLGDEVGYQVRFEKKAGARTRLRFVTEGILLRRLASDPELRGVSIVVFDEFHERHIAGDLGLSLARTARERRGTGAPLHVVVMSATMDPAPVAAFLDAPSFEVPGRTFPVAIEFAERELDTPLEKRVSGAVRKVLNNPNEGAQGDILVFLPGAAEMRRAERAVRDVAKHHGVDVVMLHGELKAKDQDRAVRAGPRPKIILSTNVAETSITIPTVTDVIDSGLARVARHAAWSGLPSLETERVSQASAKQRAGRAGRTRHGRCIRLYTKHDHDRRPAQDAPEIARADLAETALLLLSLGHDPDAFPFYEAPPPASLGSALELLRRLGAVLTKEARCTDIGRTLARLPVHPRLGRLALAAEDYGVGARGVVMAGLLAERELRLYARPRMGGGGGGRRAHEVGHSDAIARLEAYEEAEIMGFNDRTLRQLDLDPASTHAARRGIAQLGRALGVGTTPTASLDEEDEALRMALLLGFPDRVARRRKSGARGLSFAGGGGADLAERSVVREDDLMVCAEVRRYRGKSEVTVASAIEPEWLLELFPERIDDETVLRLDPGTEQIERVSALRYDGLVLDESVRRDVSGPDVAAALARAALDAGLGRFSDLDALERYKRRVAFARKHGLEAPPVDDERIAEALAFLCDGKRAFRDLAKLPLVPTLQGLLPPGAPQRLDRLAPDAVSIPGRKRVEIQYEADRDPHIASRLQDFFSMADGPRVADGEVPLVLHLLAPNRRAVQVTTDLRGFWERHYPGLAKELRRRYPKHGWPDDPLTSPPTRPGRRRKS